MNFKNLLAIFLCFFLTGTVSAQVLSEGNIQHQSLLSQKSLEKAVSAVTSIDLGAYRNQLESVPLQAKTQDNKWTNTIQLPMPDGSMKEVEVIEAPTAKKALYDRYPMNKSYRVRGLDGEALSGRIAVTVKGLSGVIFTDGKTLFIEPLQNELHVSYELDQSMVQQLQCEVEEQSALINPSSNTVLSTTSNGATLREYTIAIASSTEYSAEHGTIVPPATAGTQAQLDSVNAEILINLNALNALFEREVAMTFVLPANNDDIIFWADDGSDGLDPDNRTSSAHTVINGIIGSANYDLGHVFYEIPNVSFWATSGVAGLGVVCGSSKGRGWTGAGGSYSTANFLGTFGHEVGHQFGAHHSYYGTARNCAARSIGHGYEPGSGNSIMSYEGSCNASSDACGVNHNITPYVGSIYFHAHSLEQMITHATNSGTCSNNTATGNSVPVVTVPAGATIPHSTPFTLSGSATDGDGDDLLYIWEQYDTDFMDLDCPQGAPNDAATSTTAPLFRSFDPTTGGNVRTFPQISDIINNTPTQGEILPTIARVTHYRLTARDFQLGGGAIDCGDVEVTVDGNGPFQVTTANAATGWMINSMQTIEWEVASADSYCPNVNILYSSDGGLTFPTTLLTGATNNGSAMVMMPGIETTSGRIKVECANTGVVFFDMNNVNVALVNGCDAAGGIIANPTPVSGDAGDAALNLDLLMGAETITSFPGTLVTSDPNARMALQSFTTSNCVQVGLQPNYQTFEFTVTETGTYTLNRSSSAFSHMIALYDTSYDPTDVCENWLGSNGILNGNSVNSSNPITKVLTVGEKYIVTNSGFNSGDVGNYTTNLTSTDGDFIETSNFPAIGYAQTFVAVSDLNNMVVAISESSDFTGIAFGGTYTVHGLVYLGGTLLSGYENGSFATLQTALTDETVCGAFSSNTVAVTIIGPLPVEILAFTGKLKDKTVTLDWQTTSETNNDFFTLERSTDGRNFTPIATIKGSGTTTDLQSYQYLDHNPVIGANYYRLQQTDFDGRSEYVDQIVLIEYFEEGIITIEPNPIKSDQLHIYYAKSNHGQVLDAQIFSVNGRLLQSKSFQLEKGANQMMMNVANLSNGVYILRTVENGEVKSLRFVKSN